VKPPIAGICPIIATPFTETGVLDADSFRNLVKYLCELNVNSVCLFGLASEFYKLTDDERVLMSDILLDQTSRTKVNGIVSVTDHSTEVAVRRAKEYEAKGANALTLFPPYFLQPGLSALQRHIERVFDAVSIPIILQYSPVQSGLNIDPLILADLSKQYKDRFLVKVESTPPGKYIESLKHYNNDVRCLVGYAGIQMPDALARGAVGVQPGCSFVEVYLHLFEFIKRSDTKAFEELYKDILPYIAYWMQNIELIIQVEKRILFRRDIIKSDYCRAPNYLLDEREMDKIEQFIQDFNLTSANR
jgi:2-keto-3-deoxy-L-arabinonate dehydratase